MLIQVPENIRKLVSFSLISGFVFCLCACSTAKEGDYYVRNHHNDNMTKISVQEGEIIEKEITFQQYIEETKN